MEMNSKKEPVRMKKLIAIITLSSALLSLSCAKPGEPAATGKKYTVAVIPKGTTHEFWKSIHAGANKASRDLAAEGVNVEVIWKGPLREDEREGQIQVVEGFISQGINGIVLAPLDDRALIRPVEEAKRAGIPTVIIDSGLQSDQIVSFVATDNFKGGTLAAERLGELLGGKGKILMLRYQEGSASTEQREAGFMQGIKSKYPGIEVVSSDQYAGPTRDTAKAASENLLNRYRSDIQGVFTPNESASTGMLLALQDMSLAGKLIFVGFDSSQSFIDAMRNKQMHGTVLQSPFNMGYLGVKTMVDHLAGKPIEKRIDTGVAIVTPDNLDDPKIKELLKPPVE
jgi:ribose transport system substrate-binding protein